MHSHSDVMKQRSQRINFAEKRVKKIMGGYVPPVTPHYASSASPFEASEDFSVGAPSHRQQPNRVRQYGGYQSVPKSQNSSGTSSLDEELIPLLYGAVGSNLPTRKR